MMCNLGVRIIVLIDVGVANRIRSWQYQCCVYLTHKPSVGLYSLRYLNKKKKVKRNKGEIREMRDSLDRNNTNVNKLDLSSESNVQLELQVSLTCLYLYCYTFLAYVIYS